MTVALKPTTGRRPGSFDWGQVRTVARTDLKQLIQARDFWLPMMILGSFFFVIIPTMLLFTITSIGDVEVIGQISQTIEVLPQAAQDQILGDTPEGQTAYALAVFLFAPVAVIHASSSRRSLRATSGRDAARSVVSPRSAARS